MIPVSRMKRAATAGLCYLRNQEGVEEAEIFVAANAQLFARLNFTSHIPSNGVEEPKSVDAFGVGVRAVFSTVDGWRVGFGSAAGGVDEEAVAEALAKARGGAVLDPEFHGLPRPVGGRRTLRDYHDPALMRMKDGDLVGAGWTVLEGALLTFESSEDLALAAGSGDLAAMGLVLGGDVTVLQERIAIASTSMPRVQSDQSTLIMSFATAMVEREEAKGNGWAASHALAGFDDRAGREAAANAVRSIGGVRVAGGSYDVVFGPQAVSDLMNFLVVPSLSLGTFHVLGSAFQGKLGQRVAAEGVHITDDSSTLGLVGSKGITCEGLPTGRTDLVRDGVLVGLLANDYEYRRALADPGPAKEKLGADPRRWRKGLAPRNGFRFARGGGRHFDAPPGIAATNVLIESDAPRSREELLGGVGEGLYIGRIWYTYPVNGLRAGDFTCTVVADSYRIRDGRLAEPLKANSLRITDNIVRLLNAVAGVGGERRPTVVWAADEIIYAPEIAVRGVEVQEIGSFLAAGG